MLLSFRVANHRSLRDEQQLLLVPSGDADDPDAVNREAVRVAGLFGPNASGKSNVIDALVYMRNMVRGSFRESEPGTGIRRHSFALDPDTRKEPSTYVVDLLLREIRHTYGFSVDDDRVTEEWMYSYPQGQEKVIFNRQGDEYFEDDSPDSMRQVQEITESNVLFLSVAARSRQPAVRTVYQWFANLLDRKPLATRYPRFPSVVEYAERPGYLDRLNALLRAADTGIESAEIVEESEAEFAARSADPATADWYPGQRRKNILFNHKGESGTFALGLGDQSLGTRTLYELGPAVFRSLDRGTPLLVDELDASLHPYLSAQLVKLFRDPVTNPRGAQLVFSSHDTTLLGRIQGEEVLRRDHVWFTEKDECGATELFPLSAFNATQENRERRYLTGRYGAVPIVNDELFAAALAARGEAGDVPPDEQIHEGQLQDVPHSEG
ncbi:ATP-binding protein [Streptosporangium sp. NPDC048047]|uniref:AAA family ATPase n=1 Tax=Streptosporangium sp. NPDC048047 TaxID=3155748 RepID=UPI00342506E8